VDGAKVLIRSYFVDLIAFLNKYTPTKITDFKIRTNVIQNVMFATGMRVTYRDNMTERFNGLWIR